MWKLGRFLIAWRALDSSWDLWGITDALSPVLLTSPNHWSPWPVRTSLSFGDRPVPQHSLSYETLWSGHLFWLFRQNRGNYVLDTDASNFGLGGVLSQIQNNVECVIAYCSRALRPSQRKYCTTKREMLAAVSMCIQFCSYLRGTKFTLRTDHKSLVWLHRFKGTGVGG